MSIVARSFEGAPSLLDPSALTGLNYESLEVTLSSSFSRKYWWSRRVRVRDIALTSVHFLSKSLFVTAEGLAGCFTLDNGWRFVDLEQLSEAEQDTFRQLLANHLGK